MKFLERFAMIIYSYIILVLAVVTSLIIFNWIRLDILTEMIGVLLTGVISSKIILGVCVIFILLSIKCLFFDETSKEKLKESQGILLKNENGKLLISRDSIDNMVKNAVMNFESVKECATKILVDEENQITIMLNLTVNENVIIKELASNLQVKIKEDIKKISDIEVKEVNVKIAHVQESKNNKE